MIDLLDIHAPIKNKYIRANESAFMNKSIKKQIMHRTKLKNKFIKLPSDINKQNYKRQRNYVVSLVRNAKKQFFNNLNINCITNVKSFWKTVKPSFTEKLKSNQNITIMLDGHIVTEKQNLVDTFNKYFSNIIAELGITNDFSYLCDANHIADPVYKAIHRYSNHPSIILINDKLQVNDEFSFSLIDRTIMFAEICKLDSSKASPLNKIPIKIFKQFANIYDDILTNLYNNAVIECIFPENLKCGDLTPIYKKDDPTNMKNYRPISILPVVSKLFEKLMSYQLNNYMEKYFSKYLCGFRKGHSPQHCLTVMVKKMKECIDNIKGSAAALLTDLSKAFDCF